MADLTIVFITASVIIFIGFLGEAFFRRTGFPSILFLIMFGVLLGPVAGIFTREMLEPVTPHLIALALIMILFHGGMEMSLSRVFAQSGRAVVLAVVYFLLVAAAVGLAGRSLLGLGWVESFLFGPMIAGTSSVVIIPLSTRIGLREETSTTLSIESTITDVLNIVVFLTLANLIVATPPMGTGASDPVREIAARFGVGILLGFVAGVLWLGILNRLRREQYTYISTIAVVIFTYFAAERLGGSGVLSALVMGLVLGNPGHVAHFVRMKIEREAYEELQAVLVKFQSELAFLMRAFFFVFLGLIYDISMQTLAFSLTFGLLFTGLNMVFRYIAVFLSAVGSPMAAERPAMTVLCGQGLAHATLAVLPFQLGLPNAAIYPLIVVTVIITTNAITSAGALIISRRARMRKIREAARPGPAGGAKAAEQENTLEASANPAPDSPRIKVPP